MSFAPLSRREFLAASALLAIPSSANAHAPLPRGVAEPPPPPSLSPPSSPPASSSLASSSPHSSSTSSSPPPPIAIATPTPQIWGNADLSVAWIGHSTMLIKCAGKWILTDPVFFDVIGVRILGIPMGLRRNTPPALPFDALPKPDLVLLSHAHIDHADLPTLEALTRHYPHELTLVTAKNTTDVMECMNWGNILELDWNQDHTFDGVNIRALPVIHNGGRMPFDRDRANGYKKTGRSYNAYRIAGGGMSAVFGGDTAYTPAFKHLAEEGGVDVAMMPIGAYRHYEHLHCTPEQSLQMADEMEARYFVPMHCMTFRQSEEPPAEPLERLQAAAPNAHTQIAFTHIGHTLTLFGDSATEQARMPLAANE